MNTRVANCAQQFGNERARQILGPLSKRCLKAVWLSIATNTFTATINREKFLGVKIQNIVLPQHTLPTFIKRHPLTNTRHVTGEDAYGCIIMDAAFVGASSDLVRRMECHQRQGDRAYRELSVNYFVSALGPLGTTHFTKNTEGLESVASRNPARGSPTQDGRSERGASVRSWKSIEGIHRREFVMRDP